MAIFLTEQDNFDNQIYLKGADAIVAAAPAEFTIIYEILNSLVSSEGVNALYGSTEKIKLEFDRRVLDQRTQSSRCISIF